jgi:hypothetical protein
LSELFVEFGELPEDSVFFVDDVFVLVDPFLFDEFYLLGLFQL